MTELRESAEDLISDEALIAEEALIEGEAAGATIDPSQAACPVPRTETERVLLGHGSGGQLSAGLLRDLILPALGGSSPAGPQQDAALIPLPQAAGSASAAGAAGAEGDSVGTDPAMLVMSTDSFVVSPLFFPGGDIGDLAVHGTINDVAMMGARPLALSIAYVIEEGFPLSELRRVTESVGRAAAAAGVPVVTGDTKVVGRGAADGLFLNSTGIGLRLPEAAPGADRARTGDVILLSGPIGLHGTTVLSVRTGLGFESDIASDTRPLHRLVEAMIDAGGPAVHTLRDPTRGGLASALNEIADSSRICVELEESAVPVPPSVAAACELLGLDPMHVANEGCLVAFVAPESADAVLAAMREVPEGAAATRIGTVVEGEPGRVLARTLVGSRRIVDMLVGEQLPRIC